MHTKDTEDFYGILGVERGASQNEIKSAYRRLALKYHPDRNPEDKNAEERFKKINEAYSCLGNPEKRVNYDRFGTPEGAGAGFGSGAGFGDVFEDIFSDFFGAFTGRRQSRRAKGSDLRFDMEIDLTEAAFGAEKTISVPVWENCAPCNSTGSKNKSPAVCPDCKGSGQISFKQGFFSVSRTCGKCRGKGSVITDPCAECGGTGKVRKLNDISVRIPAGVDTGSRLAIKGRGEPGHFGGPPGDLYVFLSVNEHPFFKRDGMNLFIEVPVSFPQAALGSDVEVPTMEGFKKIKIPPGTQPGAFVHLKGLGLPRPGSAPRGDQICIINVIVPKKLSPEQKRLLEELAKSAGDETSKGFKEKFKDLFSVSVF